MSERVFFSRHVDQADYAETLNYLVNSTRPVVQGPRGRDPELLCGTWVQLVGAPLFAYIAETKAKGGSGNSNGIERLGRILLAHAAFGEALRRWPEQHVVDVEFIEEHAYVVDRQLRYYELAGQSAALFALTHQCSGDLCEASDTERALGKVSLITFPNIEFGKQFSLLDVFTPVYTRMEKRANAERDMSKRFKAGIDQLFSGAEDILALAEYMNGPSA